MANRWRKGALSVAILFLWGCAAPRHNLSETGEIFLQIVPTRPASVSQAKVYREVGSLVITGKVAKPHKFYLPGTVHIAVYDPGGVLLAKADPKITGYASRRGGAKEARFFARLDQVPPKGSTVRLEYRAAAVR